MWAVRCGTKINIWLDCWVIGYNSPPVPVTGFYSLFSYNLVCDLFLPDTRVWNIDLINSLFSPDTAKAILNMKYLLLVRIPFYGNLIEKESFQSKMLIILFAATISMIMFIGTLFLAMCGKTFGMLEPLTEFNCLFGNV